MAISADMGLPKSQPSVLRSPASRPQSPNIYRPPSISDASVQSAVNNQLEAGAGARDVAIQSLDNTKGLSRGRGINYAADMAQANADATARSGAYATEAGAADSNARAQFAYESALRNQQIGAGGLLDGLRHQQAMEALNNRGLQQNINEAYRRGQFGLDSIRLDLNPLLAGLMQ